MVCENIEYILQNMMRKDSNLKKLTKTWNDEDLLEIEKVCITAFLEGMSKIKEERKAQAMQGESGVREYIYNF